MKYDTVFPAFADRMVSRLAAIGAVGAAAAFLKWEWTVAAGFAAGVVFHILFFLYMKQRYIHWEKEKRDAAYIGQMGAALAGSRLFVEAGLAGGGGFKDTAFHSWLPGGLIVTVPCYYLGKAIVWNKNNIFLTSKKERG